MFALHLLGRHTPARTVLRLHTSQRRSIPTIRTGPSTSSKAHLHLSSHRITPSLPYQRVTTTTIHHRPRPYRLSSPHHSTLLLPLPFFHMTDTSVYFSSPWHQFASPWRHFSSPLRHVVEEGENTSSTLLRYAIFAELYANVFAVHDADATIALEYLNRLLSPYVHSGNRCLPTIQTMIADLSKHSQCSLPPLPTHDPPHLDTFHSSSSPSPPSSPCSRSSGTEGQNGIPYKAPKKSVKSEGTIAMFLLLLCVHVLLILSYHKSRMGDRDQSWAKGDDVETCHFPHRLNNSLSSQSSYSSSYG